MAEAYKGLVIRIGADTTKLEKALRASDNAIKETQKQLRLLERAAKVDPSNMRVMSERLEQMGSRASTLARRFATVNDAARQLKAAGVAKLAEQTRDAAYQAEHARERYAEICDQIKRYKNALATAAGFNLKTNDPFKGVQGYKASLKVMNRIGATAEETARYSELVAEYWSRLAEKDIAEKVEQFKQLKVQLAANGAEARGLYTEMARLAAENPAATQTAKWRKLSEQLSRVGEAAREAEARMSRLDEAMRLDPSLVGIAEQKMAAMQERIRSNVSQMRLLNAQLSMLRDRGADQTAASMTNLAAKTERVKARVAELNAEMDGLRANGAFDAQSADAKRLASQLERATALLNRMAEAGVYQGASARMSLLAAQTTKLASELSGASAMSERMRGSMQQLGWSMYSTVTPAFTMFAASAIRSAEEVDAAYRNMRKTVQGTDEQFETLRKHALDFSRTHFTSADQLLEIEAMGGQLGVATSKLEDFAKTVSNVEIATDLDADTASQQLGQLQGILNDMTQDDFARYGDALVRLGNNNATLESRIQDVMLRIASMGTITGFTTPQLLAWSTAVAATGQGCEAAGTAISKTMSDIEGAVGKGGESLAAFAEVAGMTSTEFASAWKSDPSAAMKAFVEGLKQVEAQGGSADATLASLGITSVRQKQSILGLMQTVDGLNANLEMSADAWAGVSDEWGAAGDAAREADRKAEGFSGAIQILRNNFQAFGAEVGESVAPVIRALSDAVAGLTQAYSDAPEAVKQLLNVLVAVAALMGPALVMTSAFANAWKQLQVAVKAKAAWDAAGAGARAVNDALRQLVSSTVASTAANGANAASSLVMSGAQKVAAAATNVLGAALKKLPWVAVAALVVETAQTVIDYAGKLKTAREATDGMREAVEAFDSSTAAQMSSSLSDVATSAQGTIQAQADLAKSLRDSQGELGSNAARADACAEAISRLAGKSNLTASEQTELRAAVDGLNTVCGTNVRVVDAVNGKLSESTKDILANTRAWKANAKAQAAQKAYGEVYAQQIENERQLAEVTAKLEESSRGWGLWIGDFPVIASPASDSYHDLENKAKTLQDAIDENSDAMDYFADAAGTASDAAGEYSDSATEAAGSSSALAESLGMTDEEFSSLVAEVQAVVDGNDALKAALDAGGTSVEEFAVKLSNAGVSVTELQTAIESYSKTATDAFNRIESASDLSLDQMLENMRENTELTDKWADNIAALYARAGSDSERQFISYIASLGPQYAAQVQALVDSADTYMPLFGDAMGRGAKAGVDAATAQLGILPGEAGKAATDAASAVKSAAETSTPTTAEAWAALADASAASVATLPGKVTSTSEDASSGFAGGISGAIDVALANAGEMAQAAMEMNKYSGRFYRWGYESSSNFAAGISEGKGRALSAARSVADAVARVLGHSVPKEGPLSNHGRGEAEWGAHLVQNFVAGMESEESALRAKVEMIPNAVRDAVERAQEYVSGGASLQMSVASSLGSRRAAGERAASVVSNSYYSVGGVEYAPDTDVAEAVEGLFRALAATGRMDRRR